jgi:hypothetical protein
MRKEKDEVVRCGYKVGGAAERDQGFDKEYAKGGKAKKNCYADGGEMHGMEVGNRKSESYTREFSEGGGVPTRVKKAFGGPMNGQGNAQSPQGGAQNPNQMRKPGMMMPGSPQAASNPQPPNFQAPVMMNYGLKKGGKLSAKAAVKEMLKVKEIKAPKPSAALIESITIRPKKSKESSVCIEEGGKVQEKAIGGAAKTRQGTFGLKGNPPIKR